MSDLILRRASRPWREYLTDEERAVLAAADAAKTEWQRLNQARAGIVNRAIQRSKRGFGMPHRSPHD